METKSNIAAWETFNDIEKEERLMQGKRFYKYEVIKMENKISINNYLNITWASLVAQRVKNLPAMQETWVWSLGREDHLE